MDKFYADVCLLYCVDKEATPTGDDMMDVSNSEDDSLWLMEDYSLPVVELKWKNAKFLLGAKEQLRLTHAGVDDLCGLVQSFVEDVCEEMSQRIETRLARGVGGTSLRNELLDACNPGDLFSDLTTRYSREKYYKEHFNYVVSIKTLKLLVCLIIIQEPSCVLLGINWDWTVKDGKRRLTEVKHYGYIVDFLEGLKVRTW